MQLLSQYLDLVFLCYSASSCQIVSYLCDGWNLEIPKLVGLLRAQWSNSEGCGVMQDDGKGWVAPSLSVFQNGEGRGKNQTAP